MKNNRIHQYITDNHFEKPMLVFSTERLQENFHKFENSFASAKSNFFVHYAVKANPHPSILKMLHQIGSRFDAASIGEIRLLASLGVPGYQISFGNTVKHPEAIREAQSLGVWLYSVDSEEEIRKVAEYAPGSAVLIRLLVRSTEAEWPLSRKFGCSISMVPGLMDLAEQLGLEPAGISFHVGSQTRHPHMWIDTLEIASAVWNGAIEQGRRPFVLNIGGGFPSYYGVEITDTEQYGKFLSAEISSKFPGLSYLMAEPGRAMVANLGSIAANVLLVSRKTDGDPVRWVYLDVGRFSGLAETEQEAIKYQFIVPGKQLESVSPCIIAGPTCDSADVLYETHKVMLPDSLKGGDKIIIDNTGAYTITYSTIAFNGFDPLAVIEI